MSAKHTPGPWSLQTRQTQVYVSACDFQIALLCDGDSSQIEANARLIAAAPDMLAALKDALRSSRKDFEWGADGDRQHREAYAEQFAAIDKAEGRL